MIWMGKNVVGVVSSRMTIRVTKNEMKTIWKGMRFSQDEFIVSTHEGMMDSRGRQRSKVAVLMEGGESQRADNNRNPAMRIILSVTMMVSVAGTSRASISLAVSIGTKKEESNVMEKIPVPSEKSALRTMGMPDIQMAPAVRMEQER